MFLKLEQQRYGAMLHDYLLAYIIPRSLIIIGTSSWNKYKTYATVCDVAPANAPHTNPPRGDRTVSPVSLLHLDNLPFVARMASLKVSYAKNPNPGENAKGDYF